MVEDALLGFGEGIIHDRELFSCLTCYACSLKCPSDVDFPLFMQKMRTIAANAGEYGQPAHSNALHSLMRLMSDSSIKQSRLDWLTDENQTSEESDILFFVGCAPYFDPFFEFEGIGVKTLDIVKGSLKILNKLGIKPKLLPNERCCGHDMLWTGDIETFKRLAEQNAALIREARVKKIIFSCPECYRTFKLDYPNYVELGCELQHISEFLAERIGENGLKFKEIKKKVTYQDPCRLGRHLGVYDAPRKALEAIPGIQFIEMERNREWSLCCGTSAFTNCDSYSNQIRLDRLLEARDTGAETLITCCPKCQTHFKCAMTSRTEERRPEVEIEVMDLANLVADALEGK
jgi:Fe-S oxidoreductase